MQQRKGRISKPKDVFKTYYYSVKQKGKKITANAWKFL